MRNCIRCGSEMKEHCSIKVAICPECGEVSIYIENTDKIK